MKSLQLLGLVMWGLFSSNLGWSKPVGLNVVYSGKSKLRLDNPKSYHEKLGFRLVYRSDAMDFDFVVPLDEKKWKSDASYERLCDQYNNNRDVALCSIQEGQK